jgi:hypothetical protein
MAPFHKIVVLSEAKDLFFLAAIDSGSFALLRMTTFGEVVCF